MNTKFTNWKLLPAIILISVLLLLFVSEEEPLSAKDILRHACAFQVEKDPSIVKREFSHSEVWSIQGTYYWDQGVIRISKADAKKLLSSLDKNPDFSEKEHDGYSYYHKFVAGKIDTSCKVNVNTGTIEYRLTLS